MSTLLIKSNLVGRKVRVDGYIPHQLGHNYVWYQYVTPFIHKVYTDEYCPAGPIYGVYSDRKAWWSDEDLPQDVDCEVYTSMQYLISIK